MTSVAATTAGAAPTAPVATATDAAAADPIAGVGATPWYRQFWPWFVIAIPAATVIACAVTITLAITHPDPIVRRGGAVPTALMPTGEVRSAWVAGGTAAGDAPADAPADAGAGAAVGDGAPAPVRDER